MNLEGAVVCLNCPAGTSSPAGAALCYNVDENGDSDCDGIPDANDDCPGGDDNGPCDANSFPGFNNIPAGWKCGRNNNKVLMCHEGNTICVSSNAVNAHLNHGDFLGPCVSCDEGNRTSPIPGNNGGFETTEGLSMRLYPNPTGGRLFIDLNGLENSEATLAVFNPLGSMVYEQTIAQYTDFVELDLSSQKIATGEYFVRVTSNDGVVVHKFVLSNR